MATIQKKNSRGHTYWQIVESRRVGGKPRPIVLMHLGSAESLLRRLLEGSGKPVKARVMQFGALAALWNLAVELDVVATIDRHVPKRGQGLSCGQYMLLAALNRCVAAGSKASLYDWYRQTVLHRLLPVSKASLASQRFWDHMGYFHEQNISAIEQELAGRIIEDHQIDLSTLIFDATNFDTYIATQTAGELAQRGHAKSKRADLRLVGLALLVSSDFHIPLLSHLYPGNQNDSKLFTSVAEALAERYRRLHGHCSHITLVFDGGNVSKANMKIVEDGPYHFITSLTLTHHSDLMSVPLDRFNSFAARRLEGTQAYRTTKQIWGVERTVVLTHSQELLRGQIAGITAALRKRRAALRQLKDKLARSRRPGAGGKGYSRQSLEKRLDAIGRGQYISQILKIEIIESDGRLDFSFRTDQRAYQELRRTRLGKRILCTDNHQWSSEQIILASRTQFHIEDAFKQMKDPHWVSFSPAFHWTDGKLRVHAFYCVLALMLSSLLRRKAAEAGLELTINALFEQLSRITEVITLYPPQRQEQRGRLRAEYVLSERSPLQQKLCEIFDLHSLARS